MAGFTALPAFFSGFCAMVASSPPQALQLPYFPIVTGSERKFTARAQSEWLRAGTGREGRVVGLFAARRAGAAQALRLELGHPLPSQAQSRVHTRPSGCSGTGTLFDCSADKNRFLSWFIGEADAGVVLSSLSGSCRNPQPKGRACRVPSLA